MKTTALHFAEFKQSFLDWQQKLGLMDYEIVFEREKLKGAIAQIQISTGGRIALVTLTTEMSDKADIARFDPRQTAKHEALHLLLRRATSLVSLMGVTHREVEDTEEGIVRVLERVV